MTYKCIIIDDETHAIEGLERYIATIPELEVLKTYDNPLLALTEILNGPNVDLIFLDVDMPMINGLELAKEIRKKTNKLVFTTGYTEYAYEAFESNADAYLLKPYSIGKFVIAISKLFPNHLDQGDLINHKAEDEKDDFFFVKSTGDNLKLVKVRFDDIIAVESKINYILINTLKRKVLTYMSLTEISKILMKYQKFIQPQRSYIINKHHIEAIDGNTIKMVDGENIAIGEHFRKDFNSFLAEKVIKGAKK